tara:strand:+ start:503 stop:2965 length:2463 start_codon:yes stop_codon:yes gene_type:complete
MSILRLFLLLLQLAFLFVGIIYFIFSRDLPKIETITEIKLTNPMRIYASNDELIGLFGTEKRQIVKFDEIPDNLKYAIIAAEDGDFFKHSGVEITSLIRALYGEISGRSLGGGGTITMQVVRNYVLSFERTYERKLKEIFLAWRLEDYLDKEEIFELYFNKAFLGNRNYGFAAAYQYYFGKDFSEATISESALLAGILQRPSRVNPVRSPAASKSRRDLILRRMLSRDFIDNSQFEEAKAEIVTGQSFGPKINIEAEYIAERIRAEIINKFGPRAYEEGMNIYTTLDSDMQTNAVRSLRENLYNYDKKYGWRNEEVYKDFNFSILKSVFQEEGIFMIPSRINYEEAKEENLEKLQNLLDAKTEPDGLTPSLVISIDDSSVQTIDSKLRFNSINWSDDLYAWARQNNTDGTRSPRPEKFSDFIEIGSLVYIKNKDEILQISQVPEVEAAFVAIDGLSGSLKAYVGGFDFEKSKFDRAGNSKLLPGSSIKPFIYGCAFENELNPSSIFIDGPIIFEDKKLEGIWRPRNNSGEFLGPIRLREALIQSLNIVSIKIVQSLGLEKVLDCFKKYNFDEQMLINDLSIALGTGTINPFKAAENYSILINKGESNEIFYIDRVEDIDGNIIFDPKKRYAKKVNSLNELSFPWLSSEKLDYLDMPMVKARDEESVISIDPRVAFMVSDILNEALVQNAKRRGLKMPISNMGGKTGTTNDATSTWFSGYASHLVASAWVGKDDGSSLGDNEFGSTNALPIWMDFMHYSQNKLSDYSIDVPEGIAAIRIDKESGKVSQSFENSIFEYFLEENVSDLLSSDNRSSDLKEILN